MNLDAASLFNFPATTLEEWKNQILRELKGEPYTSLIWDIDGDLQGEPVYHSSGERHILPLPGKVRSGWQITSFIPEVKNVQDANKMAIHELQMGAEALFLENVNPDFLTDLLKGVHLQMIRLVFKPTMTGSAASAKAWHQTLQNLPIEGQYIIDITSFQDDYTDMLAGFSDRISILNQSISPVDKPVQQLLSWLCSTHQCIRKIGQSGQVLPAFAMQLDMGPDFILEIARLRAIRWLWRHLLRSWNLNESVELTILARITPGPNVPWEDVYIHQATIAMSAVLGGADMIMIIPPDQKEWEMAARISRNIHHLLREEAHMHHTIDPMAGSYAIESITQQIAEKTWALFEPV